MKKLFAFVLSLLMTIFVFASCDTDAPPEESSLPVEPSSVELSSDEPSSDLEEESSIPVKSPIPYTAEDQKYFEKYGFQLAKHVSKFSDPSELDGSGLFSFFVDIYISYEADDYGDKYYGEDGLYHVPLADVTDVLNRYLGEGYSEKVQEYKFYNSKTQCFDMPGFVGGSGVASLNKIFPAPIRREGKCVVVPFYVFNEDYSEIVNAFEFTIEEYKDGFYVRKNIRLTEEEIADLNEKYFGEA